MRAPESVRMLRVGVHSSDRNATSFLSATIVTVPHAECSIPHQLLTFFLVGPLRQPILLHRGHRPDQSLDRTLYRTLDSLWATSEISPHPRGCSSRVDDRINVHNRLSRQHLKTMGHAGRVQYLGTSLVSEFDSKSFADDTRSTYDGWRSKLSALCSKLVSSSSPSTSSGASR